jgi:hypothetical protein
MSNYPDLQKVMMRPMLIAVMDFFVLMAIGTILVF